MKRFFTFLTAASMTFGMASAADALYLVGAPSGWDEPNADHAEKYEQQFKFEKGDDGLFRGEWTFSASDYFRFYTSLNGWDTDSYGPAANVLVTFEDNSYSSGFETAQGCWFFGSDFASQPVSITVDMDNHTVTMTSSGLEPVKPDPIEADVIYLVGNPTGWAEPSSMNADTYSAYTLAKISDGVYEGYFTFEGDQYFRFYSALSGWDEDSYGPFYNDGDNTQVVLDADNTYTGEFVKGKGCWFTAADFGTQPVKLTVDFNTFEMTFVAGVDAPEPPEPVAVENLYLVGDLTGWTEPSEINAEHYAQYALSQVTEGVFQGSFTFEAGQLFRFYSALTGWESNTYGSGIDDGVYVTVDLDAEGEFKGDFVKGKGNWRTPDDFTTRTVVITMNFNTSEMTFDAGEQPVPVEAAGEIRFESRNLEDGAAVEKLSSTDYYMSFLPAGTYSAEEKAVVAAPDTKIEFAVSEEGKVIEKIQFVFVEGSAFAEGVEVSATYADPDNANQAQAPEAESTSSIELGDTYAVWTDVEPAAKTVTFTPANECKIVSVMVTTANDPQGAIATVVTEDLTPEYFNLQGVRIAAPAKGQIVIERRGASATKRVF